MTGVEPLAALRGLRSSVVADALDGLGLRSQCLAPGLAPLDPGRTVAGTAYPIQFVVAAGIPEEPYVELLRAIDGLGPGDVAVIATGRSDRAAVWGELLSTAALATGVAGLVTDGLVRDVAGIRALGFPVVARGTSPYDENGRLDIASFGEPVVVDGVLVERGDLVLGDEDGVVVVPREAAAEALARARDKTGLESEFRSAVAGGAGLVESYRRFGVL